MSLKILFYFGILTVVYCEYLTDERFNTTYLVPSEAIGREITVDEVRIMNEEFKIEDNGLLPVVKYGFNPSQKETIEKSLFESEEYFIITSDDKNNVVFEVFVDKIEPLIGLEKLGKSKNFKVESQSISGYYAFYVEPENASAFEAFLGIKGIPIKTLKGMRIYKE